LSENAKYAWLSPVVKIAAAGVGAAIAGPIGGLVAGSVGAAIFGEGAGEAVKRLAEKFGDEAGQKLTETGAESLADKLSESDAGLEAAYRNALRASLDGLPANVKAGREDWFANWNRALEGSMSLQFSPGDKGKLVPEKFDEFFAMTMARLDAQGTALQKDNVSLTLTCRALPDDLSAALLTLLPERLERNFTALIVTSGYDEGWKEVQLAIQKYETGALGRIEKKLDVLPEMADAIKQLLARTDDGRLRQQLEETRAENARLATELQALREQAAKRAHEPGEAALSEKLAAKDIAGAVEIKRDQIDAREREAHKLPQDYFDLGTMYELQQNGDGALEAFHRAWQMTPTVEFGFRYASVARRQRHYAEALDTYRQLLNTADEVTQAAVLANMGTVFSDAQQFTEGERAFSEAVTKYRELEQKDSAKFAPPLSGILQSFGDMYQRMHQTNAAKPLLLEALEIRKKLAATQPAIYRPLVALSLQSIGSLMNERGSFMQAWAAFGESLGIVRELVAQDRDTYLPLLAQALSNVAVAHNNLEHSEDAAETALEALRIRQELARKNPEAYGPEVAMSLTNIGLLYSRMGRLEEAENAYKEAIATFRKLAETQPDVYLPYLGNPLNNLAMLCSQDGRTEEAESTALEVVELRRKLWAKNPETIALDLAKSLANLAVLYRSTNRPERAAETAAEAESVLEPLWKAEPLIHGDMLAQLYILSATVAPDGPDEARIFCTAIRKAFEAARDPQLKHKCEQTLVTNCGGVPDSPKSDS
jgi:tetratricopeptide (TPR) repeat protein